MLDGAARLNDVFDRCNKTGMSAIAITDHGNLYGAYDFYKKAKAAGVKPIIGIEAYVAPEHRAHKQPVRWGTPAQRDDDVSGSSHARGWAENRRPMDATAHSPGAASWWRCPAIGEAFVEDRGDN